MGSEEKKHDRIQLDVYLNEYHACYRQRNHYDSVLWTIGSIFIGVSFALFGASFQEHLIEVPGNIIFLSVISFGLIVVWYLYLQHVNPWILAAILRMHEIEVCIIKMGYNIRLQNLVRSLGREHRPFPYRGIRITYAFFMLSITAWFFRYTMISDFIVKDNIIIMIGILILCLVYFIHTRIFNTIQIDNMIASVREEECPESRDPA